MSIDGLEPARCRVLRPKERLILQAIIAVLALFVPLFFVVYWLSIPGQTWTFVLEVQCALTALGMIGAFGVSKMTVRVDTDGLTIQGLLGRVTNVAVADIGSLLLVELYQSGSVDSLPHLYVLDAAGHVLVHLRGQVWARSTIESIIDELDIAALRVPDPLTLVELGLFRPQLVRPWVRYAAQLSD
jgi:hypothetical protein